MPDPHSPADIRTNGERRKAMASRMAKSRFISLEYGTAAGLSNNFINGGPPTAVHNIDSPPLPS
jgi:hypothetical protein